MLGRALALWLAISMSKLSRLHTKGAAWIRSRATVLKQQYKRTDRVRRSPKYSDPWWKKDVGRLLADIGRMRFGANSGIPLQSIMDLSNWTVRFRMVFLVLVFILGILLAMLVLSSNKLSDLRVQNSEIKILQSRYLMYAEQADMLPAYQAQTEKILERFGALLDAIPAALESVHVLTQLNTAAKDSGLQLEFFKPLAEETHAYYVVLPIEIRLRGDYNAIARFLELVSKMQHLVTVDVVMLASATHANQIVLASLLKAYRYKDLPIKSESRVPRDTP